VSQRTYEISLRMAIGASNSSIVRMILTQSLRVAFAGLIAGLIGAAFATRTLSALLFNVAPIDPLVYISVPLVLCLVAAAASALPAWRASRIDPIRVLRAE
jgi:putative ABC transport system permease protein